MCLVRFLLGEVGDLVLGEWRGLLGDSEKTSSISSFFCEGSREGDLGFIGTVDDTRFGGNIGYFLVTTSVTFPCPVEVSPLEDIPNIETGRVIR